MFPRHLLLLLALVSIQLSLTTQQQQRRRGKHGKVVRRIKKIPTSRLKADTADVFPGVKADSSARFQLASNLPLDQEKPSQRFFNPFSLFNVVQFPNTECTSEAGVGGTCYTSSECTKRGGTGSGSCAGGFGVCCVFSTPCNSETAENGTYFSSPTSLSSVCSIMIRPMDDDICQVRLDFEELVLMDPDETGNCRVDYLQLSGGISNSGQMPTICGTNNGQHVIYSAIPSFPARLSVVVDTMMTAVTRSWRIKISQFACSSPSLAPEGCLQYYTGISGNISSFNWKLTDNNMGATFSNHIANLQYSACVRRESGYCAIEWSTPSPYADQKGYFSLTDAEVAATVTALAATNVKVGDADCQTDYVMIPGGWGGTDINNRQFAKDRFCGQALGYCSAATGATCTKALGSVKSYVTPFQLGVVTDLSEGTATAQTDTKNRGFRLNFRQHPCN